MPEEVIPPVTPSPETPLTTPPTPPETPPASPPTEPPKVPEAPKAPEAPAALTAEAIKLPEGFEVDAAAMGDFLGIMNDTALDGASRAQKLIDLQTKFAQAQSEKAMETWTKLQDTWQNEAKADPDVGGDKLEGNLAKISTLINVHGSPELREIMTQTGAGNNVHVIKFLSKIATAMGESLPAPASTPGSGERSAAQTLFPNMK